MEEKGKTCSASFFEGILACRPLIESYSADGFRTVLFGEYTGTLDGQPLTEPMIPMGLILLTNPIRRDAPETFRYFTQQGVAIKVISGDNPLTVSQIAMEAGIPGAEHCIDASALNTEEAVYEAATHYTVFGRVTPEQKRQLVRALQSQAHEFAALDRLDWVHCGSPDLQHLAGRYFRH